MKVGTLVEAQAEALVEVVELEQVVLKVGLEMY
jgi:hypothetical protein